MAQQYDKSAYYIDFSDHDNLTTDEKNALQKIQETLRPIERAQILLEYKALGKITADEFEKMTGIPYDFGQ